MELVTMDQDVVSTIEYWVKEQVEAMEIPYTPEGIIMDNKLLKITISLEDKDGE